VEIDLEPGILQCFRRGFPFARIARRQHDLETAFRELPRDGVADPAVAAGDQGNARAIGHGITPSCRRTARS
jgi:hypothetical protein